MSLKITLPFLLVGAMCMLDAQEIDEDALFADTSFMIDSASVVDQSLAGEPDSTRVSFSGEVTSVASLAANRGWFDTTLDSETSASASIVGNLLLDVRLPGGAKTFGNLELASSSDTTAGDLGLAASTVSYGGGEPAELFVRELFLDANIAHRVYLRAGKQVLQWGRCNFWNPTDLVNVEKKSFIEKVGAREGTFGIKVHVPFGTRANIYSFVDLNDLSDVSEVAGALRSEVLIGGAELGAGVWGKSAEKPVVGFDASGTLFDFSLTGELSIQHGTRFTIIEREGPTLLQADLGDTWIPRAAVGVMRMFDFLEIDDRVTAIAEFYYNHAGLDGNIFDDPEMKRLSEMLQIDTTGRADSAAAFLLSAYEPNSHSKHYAAFFVTVSKFLFSDMSLSVNGIANLDHGAMILSSGVSYATLHNFSLGLLINAYLGDRYTEYTFDGSAVNGRLTATVLF